jgi:hypothetical protein
MAASGYDITKAARMLDRDVLEDEYFHERQIEVIIAPPGQNAGMDITV